jgi:small-conductance mechanosensitive channel
VLTTLNAFGINIGPLLAGAGILGLAVAFGSQALVRDSPSGAFFLMDDALRVGDYSETAAIFAAEAEQVKKKPTE